MFKHRVVEQPYPQAAEAEPDWGSRLAVASAVVSFIVSGVIMSSASSGETSAPGTPFESGESEPFVPCPAPSSQAKHAVDALLKAGPDKAIIRQEKMRRQAARRRVLKLRDMPTETYSDFDEFVDEANEALRPYDVTIEQEEPGLVPSGHAYDSPIGGVQTVDRDEKRQLVDATESILSQPVEYVRYTNVKKIVPYRNGQDETGAYVAGDANQGASVYLNLYGTEGYYVMPHEEIHSLQDVICPNGNYFDDPAFTDLNGGEDVYANPFWDREQRDRWVAKHPASREELENQIYDLDNLQYDAADDRDKPRFDKLEARKKALARRIITYSAYGQDGPGEDTAEIGQYFVNGWELPFLFDPTTPILQAKTKFILARLYDKRPDLTTRIIGSARNLSRYDRVTYGDSYAHRVKLDKLQDKYRKPPIGSCNPCLGYPKQPGGR